MKQYHSMNFIRHIITAVLLLPGTQSYTQIGKRQQQADHRISVSLYPGEKKLDGFQEITYTNNSLDTLRYIYFHLGPNAFRNDRTAFSDQLLINNRTDFYFSKEAGKGYINRLNFQVNGVPAAMEDHPIHQDIIKLILPQPLLPGDSLQISTPFQVKLPAMFSRSGYLKDFFAVANWYPQPAVYDSEGWQEMPYLDQGGYFNETGDYNISITLPDSFHLAAPGTLLSTERSGAPANTTTYHYSMSDITQFAWFAATQVRMISDTLQLPSGKLVNLYSYYHPSSEKTWKNSLTFMKETLRRRSLWHGEYPFSTFTLLDALGAKHITNQSYPGVAVIGQVDNGSDLDVAINQAAGRMWFGETVLVNERKYAWLNEGLNRFYSDRYEKSRRKNTPPSRSWKARFFPEGMHIALLRGLESTRRSQSIQTVSDSLKQGHFILLNQYKSAWVLENAEKATGPQLFDSAVTHYMHQYSHRHTAPDAFFNSFELVTGKGNELREKMFGPINAASPAGKNKAGFRIVSVAPLAGYNHYDGLMIGGLLHNYQLPLPRFRFLATPLYGTKSKSINGLANLSLNWYPAAGTGSAGGALRQITVGLDAARFTGNEFRVAASNLTFHYNKLAPFLRIELAEKNHLSYRERYVQYKSFLISEEWLDSKLEINGNDTLQVVGRKSVNRTLQQLKVVWADHRILYPYQWEGKLESGRDFTRLAITGNYFVNFPNREGGLKIRFFAGKFFTHGENSLQKQFNNERFYLNLTGANGWEDYTFSNYFAGRNEFSGWKSQQIMIRDGGFKVRTDLSSEKVGKTGNWLSTLNFTADIPASLNPLSKLPVKIPLKLYADLGTYKEAWMEENESTKILFSAGLQLPLFRDLVNIYIPVLNSRVFRDYNQSTLGDKKFWKTISFSIDIQQINAGKWLAKARL